MSISSTSVQFSQEQASTRHIIEHSFLNELRKCSISYTKMSEGLLQLELTPTVASRINQIAKQIERQKGWTPSLEATCTKNIWSIGISRNRPSKMAYKVIGKKATKGWLHQQMLDLRVTV